MNRWLVTSFLLTAACKKKADCEGESLYRAEDGNCYFLEGHGAEESVEWLIDNAVAANVQDRFRRNRGTAAADFDGDGHVDFYLANPDDPATLLLNTGGGVFEEQELAPTTGNDVAVAAADYDNDGDPDLWVACGGWGKACMDALYRNDGLDPETGRLVFTDVSSEAGLSSDGRQGFGVAWGDYNNDGLLDVYVSNKLDWSDGTANPANQLYRNNGDGTFVEVAQWAGVDHPGDSHTASWLDVEPDGDLDLFVPTLFGDNVLYLNAGDGTFIDAESMVLAAPYQAFGASAADFNNDGLVDLVVSANSGSMWAPEERGDEPMLFFNQGDGDFLARGFSEVLGADLPLQMRVMGFAIGDLNMDGFTDFFFGNGEPVTGGTNKLLLSAVDDDGVLELIDVSRSIDYEAPRDSNSEPYRSYPYRTHGSVMVDVDGDIDLDLFVGNGGMNLIPDKEEPNRLFVSSKSESVQRIAVTLNGMQSNRDGVGSMIRVWGSDAAIQSVHRWVTRSSGFNSSLPKQQVIGLGDRLGPYTVEVQWPSGVVQRLEGVESGEQVVVTEASK